MNTYDRQMALSSVCRPHAETACGRSATSRALRHLGCRIGPLLITVLVGGLLGTELRAADDCHGVPGDFDGDLDVDQSDFGRFKVCICESFGQLGPDCTEADLDGDGDVDNGDVAVFIRCVTGAGMVGDPFCAD